MYHPLREVFPARALHMTPPARRRILCIAERRHHHLLRWLSAAPILRQSSCRYRDRRTWQCRKVLQFPHPLFVFYSVLIEYAEFILNYFAIDSTKRRGISGLFSPCDNYDL